MDDGDGFAIGSGDRRDTSQRRKTVSGVLRSRERSKTNDDETSSAMRFPWHSPSAPSSPTTPTAPSGAKSHKRTSSGSILQRFNFLRSAGEDGRPPSGDKEVQPPKSPKSSKSRKSIDDDVPITSPTSPNNESSLAIALRPVKARKRKGSLRKTALLGGRKAADESRERRSSFAAKSPLGQPPIHPSSPNEVFPAPPPGPHYAAPYERSSAIDSPESARKFSYEQATESSDSGWSEPAAVTAARLTLVTAHAAERGTLNSSVNDLGSPLDIKSPTSQASYTSTTDEDDMLTFDRPANNFPLQNNLAVPNPASSTATSYFPTPSELSLPQRRTTSRHKRSPLSHAISNGSAYPPSPPPHDYAETEYWGWIILFITWLTFTVGMGSCFDIWSWAWDVGNKPYAPPELEDDPTLPIVGYYPALIVLTGVVAWVWITVAWVGMKYFRHAKIEV